MEKNAEGVNVFHPIVVPPVYIREIPPEFENLKIADLDKWPGLVKHQPTGYMSLNHNLSMEE